MSLLLGIGALSPQTSPARDTGDLHEISLDSEQPMSESDESESDAEEVPEPEIVIKRTKAIRVEDTSEFEDTSEPRATTTEVVGNGFGAMGRISHLAGKSFGRNDSITPLEAMPYILSDEHFVFADVRGFVTNRSQVGGNLGMGYRRLIDDWNAWTGASIWYDADHSTSKLFQQVGFSFEGLIQQFEFRSNVYLPFTSTQTIANSIGGSAIVGHQLLYSRSVDVGTALRGVDAELGYSLPVMDRHIVRGFLGGYHFEGASSGGVNGFKARIEGVINNTITAQALYTHDKLYGDNVMLGLSMQFPFGSSHPTTGWTRNTPSPFRYVERNYNVIVAESKSGADNQVATDPTTGNPYLIEQVNASPSNPGGTADGTTAHPFSSIAAAQAAGGNVFLVQSGSVLNQPIVLSSGQYLFGQGVFAESLPSIGGVSVPIPAPSKSGATPIIQNVMGDAVTLASNTEVAGFNIIGATGNGISGNGVSGVSLHDLMFTSIGGDAINLANSSGTIMMNKIQIASATGSGIVFNGGHPDISFSGAGNTITSQGDGFVLKNLTGGTDTISGLSLNSIGGNGLVINNVATNVTVSSLTVAGSGMNNSGGSAVAITGVTGTTQMVNGVPTNNAYNFTGKTTITSPTSTGFSVNATDAIINVANLNVTSSSSSSPAVSVVNDASPITFGNLGLSTQNATGLFANNVADLIVNGGSLTTVNAPAIDVASSGFNAKLSSVSVNQGPYGIKLVTSTGSFSVLGTGGSGSGGTIQNTSTAGVFINSFGNTSLNSMNFLNNAAGIQSASSTQLSLSGIQFTGSTGYAIDSLNDGTLWLSSSNLTSNGTSGSGSIRIQASAIGTYTSLIQSNTIVDSNGTAIQFVTQPAGAGATLATQVSSNTISGYMNGASLIGANWDGPVTATINSNTLNAYGPNLTAIALNDSSTTANMTATINSNTITFQQAAATGGTAIWIVDGQSGQSSTGSSTLSVTTNTVNFLGTGGIGLRFGLYAPSADTITGNTITDQAGSATGMLFDYAGAGTQLLITGNVVTLLQGDPTTHRGIIFSQVGSGLTLYTPYSSTTNTIRNAASSQMEFSIPAGTPGTLPSSSVEGILINGQTIVPPL